jgi:hypothetical protein
MTRVWVRRRNTNGFSKWHLKKPNVCCVPNYIMTECGPWFDSVLTETVECEMPTPSWSGQVCGGCQWIAAYKYPVSKVVPITLKVTVPENIGMIDLQHLLLEMFTEAAMTRAKIKRIELHLPTNVYGVTEIK